MICGVTPQGVVIASGGERPVAQAHLIGYTADVTLKLATVTLLHLL
jgi:uncharacterized protein YcsI (UPF0317 family)